jgi:hypothetical protein
MAGFKVTTEGLGSSEEQGEVSDFVTPIHLQ